MTRILLLEDELSLINGLSFALTKQGFEIEIARTMKEAGACWRKGRYNLFILDVSLPDGCGFDFCRMVRKESEVPIIFLTASDEEIILFSLYLSVGEFFIMDNITWYIIIWGIVVFEKRKYALFFVIDEKFKGVKD